jgi:hypothetical protein
MGAITPHLSTDSLSMARGRVQGLNPQMYARPVTREMEDAFRNATFELLISKSAVSETNRDRLSEDYEAFLTRDLPCPPRDRVPRGISQS